MLCQDSFMFLKPYSIVTFDNNKADYVGGGIYVEKKCLQSKPACFFQPHTDISHKPHLLNTTHVRLLNNQANYAGTAIYGGSVDYCYLFNRIKPAPMYLIRYLITPQRPIHRSYLLTHTMFVCAIPPSICPCAMKAMC